MKELRINERYAQGIKYVLSSHLAGVFIQLLTLAIIVRYISKSEFGAFILLTAIASLLQTFADFGLTGATVKYLSTQGDNKKDIISTVLWFTIIISLALCCILCLTGQTILNLFKFNTYQHIPLFISLLFFSQHLFYRFTSFFQGLYHYKYIAYAQITNFVGKLLLIVILVVFLRPTLTSLVIAVFIATTISCLLCFVLCFKYIKLDIKPSLLKHLLSFGFPLQLNNILGFVFERTDTLMLGAMVNSYAVGVFEVGYKIPNQLRAAFEAYKIIFFPQMAKLYSNQEPVAAASLLRDTLRVTSFLMSFAALIAIIFGRELIVFLFSANYANSAPVLSLLIIGLNIGLCNYVMGTAFIADGRPKLVLITAIPEAILNVILNYALIPQWSTIGAAMASAISRIVVNPLFLLLSGKTGRLGTAFSYIKSLGCLGLTYAAFAFFQPISFYGKSLLLIIFISSAFGTKAILFSDFSYLLRLLCIIDPHKIETSKSLSRIK